MSQNRDVISVSATPLDNATWSPRPGFSDPETPRLSVSYHYWNYTQDVLSVSDRFGLSYLIKPISSNHAQKLTRDSHKKFAPGFYFTVEYKQLVNRRSHQVEDTEFDSRRVLNKPQPNPILRGIQNSHEVYTDRDHNTWEVHYVDFYVSQELTDNALDCVYLHNLDLLISTKCNTSMLPHLMSEEGIAMRAEYHPTCTELPSGGLQIVHVDNTKKQPTYFVNFAGHVADIKPIQDFNMQNGFYIYKCKQETDDFGRAYRSDPEVLYYTLEEVRKGKAKFTLYLTYEEAEALGDVYKQVEEKYKLERLEKEKALNDAISDAKAKELELKRQQSEWEAEHKRKQAEWDAQFKQAMKEKEAEHEAKVNALKLELDKLKAELEKKSAERKDHYDEKSSQRKDYYEERSSSRKDSSDGWTTALKVGAAVVAAGIAVFKIFF